MGDAITGLAGTAMQVMEPRLKRKAIEQGTVDAARTVIGKDENGNYVMPDAPKGGGDAYVAAFDAAKRDQYKDLIVYDAQVEFNKIYSDPANIGLTPEDRRNLAENYVSGVLGAVDPFVEAEVMEALNREVLQRDLASSNAWLRQETELMERGFAAKVEKSSSDAFEAYTIGSAAEGDRLKGEAKAAMERLVQLRMRTPEELAALEGSFTSIAAGGAFMKEVRGDMGEGTLFADDLQKLMLMLNENDNPDWTVIVGGKEYNGEKLRALIPDSKVRTMLEQKIGQRESMARAEEAEDEKKNEAFDIFASVPLGGNFAYGVSGEEKAGAWQAWAAMEGVDLMSPEGVVRAYHRSPDLPDEMYKQAFSNMSARTGAELSTVSTTRWVCAGPRSTRRHKTRSSWTLRSRWQWASISTPPASRPGCASKRAGHRAATRSTVRSPMPARVAMPGLRRTEWSRLCATGRTRASRRMPGSLPMLARRSRIGVVSSCRGCLSKRT
ncbi:MAG: hypothetical protein LW689_04350 [Novosphingobium sp.]|nr:hypothetical protein [Novosphingobium sp.]